MKSCIVVYNPRSGGKFTRKQLTPLLKKHNLQPSHWIKIGDGFEQTLKKHVTTLSLVVAVGGDGTMGSIAGVVAEHNATLLPLPGGTLNHFTKDLGVDQDIETALDHAVKTRPRLIDIASINGTYFVNNSSLGLYPDSLVIRQDVERRLGKWPGALFGWVRSFFRFRRYYLTVGDTPIVTPFIFVGNNTYSLELLRLGSRADLDKGELWVAVARATNRWQLARIFLQVLSGTHDKAQDYHVYKLHDSLDIQTRRASVHVARDGEVMRKETPLTYRIHKKALRVLV